METVLGKGWDALRCLYGRLKPFFTKQRRPIHRVGRQVWVGGTVDGAEHLKVAPTCRYARAWPRAAVDPELPVVL